MARVKTGVAVDGPTGPERKPYGRLNAEAWAEVRALYGRGVTAKALSAAFGPAERTIYTHLNRNGCLRKDEPEAVCRLTPEALGETARAVSGAVPGSEAEAPIRALGAGASLGEAAKASAQTAILMLREGQPTRAYTYARLAATLERVARGAAGDGPVDGTERGRQAALDFLRVRWGEVPEREEVTRG